MLAALTDFTELRRAASSQEHFNAAHDVPLGGTEGWVLWHLRRQEPARPVDLAEAVGAGRSTITRALQRLKERNLVAISAHPDDARSVLVDLTEEGRASAGHLVAGGQDLITRATSSWTADDRQLFGTLLLSLTEGMRRATR
jgi:DNA-binding MarR family transcriptional regulator